MKVGMTFGVLFGAFLHTTLRYYPLRIGRNLALNSLKGALIGAPMGVCVNCAVPMAWDSPAATVASKSRSGTCRLPDVQPRSGGHDIPVPAWYFGAAKYLLVCFVILVLVPRLIGHLEDRGVLRPFKAAPAGDGICGLVSDPCDTPLHQTLSEIVKRYLGHVWMLLKPTLGLMLIASLVTSALLVLIPWDRLLAAVGPGSFTLAAVLECSCPYRLRSMSCLPVSYTGKA